MITRVLVERISQQMTISQTDIDPREKHFMQKAGLKTLLILPLVFQNRVFGLVEIVTFLATLVLAPPNWPWRKRASEPR